MPTKRTAKAPRPAADLIAAVGLEAICERIEAGESQAAIAKSINVSVASLSKWLNTPEHEKRFAQAKEASAEAWLDKGLSAIERSMRKKGAIDPQAARAYAQECARRAALRNPRYVEKTAHEHSGPGGGPMQLQRVERVIVDPANRDAPGVRSAT